MKNSEENNNCRIAVPLEFESVFSHFYYAKNKNNLPVTKTLLPSFQTIWFFLNII
jgi:hypothetical protein